MERSHDLTAELASILAWWTEAGVDTLVQDEARAWLSAQILPGTGRWIGEAETEGAHLSAAAPREGGPPPPPPSAAVPLPVPGRIDGSDPPGQLDLFQEWLRTNPALSYAAPHAPRVCPSGDPAAGLMILAAMPSSEDCAAGVLLSGAPGRLFDQMLAAIGRSRETTYLAGMSCLRPPSGRFDREGAERCAAIARHHVGLAAPKALLLLGDACSKALLGVGAAQARGRVHRLETQAGAVDAVVTLTPDYLLSQPSAKALAWADLQLLMERL